MVPGEMRTEFDVVIAGGSSAGVGAAIGAARAGATVALIEDTPVLGGMLANGISNIDAYSLESLSGVFEEFRRAVKDYYSPIMDSDPIFGTRMPMPRHADGRSGVANDPKEGGRWEPHVAHLLFQRMISELPGVKVFYKFRPIGVVRHANRVLGVQALGPDGEKYSFHGVVVDATHEGDIAAWSGAPYRVGREARSPAEPHAGEIFFFNGTGEIMGGSGRQDAGVVSYGLRLTIQHYDESDGDGHVLKAPPAGYDASQFEATAYTARLDMPHRKSEMNQNPIGNELQEINWSWPEADYATRRNLYEMYRNRALSFLYFLQHERGMTQIGLPADEYTDNGHVPYRVFVREARRIVGEQTVCEADLNPFLQGRGWIPPFRQDGIAVGHYPIDSKPVHCKTDLSTPDKGEGDFYIVNASTAFQIPYGAIVPRSVDGLLVPAALSATHVAFSSIRMDPTWIVIGQAAGIAAAISAREGVIPRRVRVRAVQRELLQQRCRLYFYWDLPLEHPAFMAVQWLAVTEVMTGYPDRTCRPDAPLTRGDMARALVKAFGLWPSVSGIHFTDVPHDHEALREIETLFDHRALHAFGIRPRWPEAGSYLPTRDSDFTESAWFGPFHPDKPVSWLELTQVMSDLGSELDGSSGRIRAVLEASTFGRHAAGGRFGDGDTVLRGEAAMFLASWIDRKKGTYDDKQSAGEAAGR